MANMKPGETLISAVLVTNENDFAITDRYDGVPYRIEAHGQKSLPLDAAMHFFGFRIDPETGRIDLLPDRQHMCRRYGWNTAKHVLERKDEEYCGKVTFQAMQRVITDRLAADELPPPRPDLERSETGEEVALMEGEGTEVQDTVRRRPGRPRKAPAQNE